MKTCQGVKAYLHHFLLWQEMMVNVELHLPAALPTGKEPPVLIERRLGGAQSQSGHCGKEKNLLRLPGTEPRPSSL
jgi:hypothetical protein